MMYQYKKRSPVFSLEPFHYVDCPDRRLTTGKKECRKSNIPANVVGKSNLNDEIWHKNSFFHMGNWMEKVNEGLIFDPYKILSD